MNAHKFFKSTMLKTTFCTSVRTSGSTIALLCTLAAGPLYAEQSFKFNIPAQNLGQALEFFGAQSGLQVASSAANTGNLLSVAVSGNLSAQEALNQLLAGTGLEYRFVNTNTVIIEQGVSNSGTAESNNRERVRDRQQEIEEMIVTATKRDTRLQDTALSITVLGNETINKRGILSMSDYLSTVPGVTMQDMGAGTSSIVIRGLSSSTQRERAATGVYFGEVPVGGLSIGPNRANVDLRMVDIERVEVLRGPQGTLYGADAMGGVVRTIPVAPDATQFSGQLAVGYSNTGNLGSDNSRVEAVVNVPIIQDKLALRAVAYRMHDSGYLKSITPEDNSDYSGAFGKLATFGGTPIITDDIGATSTKGIRLAAMWNPVEELEISLGYAWQNVDQDGLLESELNLPGGFQQSPRFLPRNNFSFPVGVPGLGAPELSPLELEGRSTETSVTSLVADYDFGWGSLHSASSWLDQEGEYSFDWSAFATFPGVGSNFSENKRFTQEVRFASQFDGPLQILAGAYYEEQEGGRTYSEDFAGNREMEAAAVSGLLDCCAPADYPVAFEDDYIYAWYSAFEHKQRAVFGELSYDITDQLTATAGVRYFEYDQWGAGYSQGYWNAWSWEPVLYYDVAGSFSGENYKANLSWKPMDGTLIYAQFAQGFRLGGPVTPKYDYCDADGNGAYETVGGGEAPIKDVEPDNTDNFEFGYKGSFADGRVSVNAAAYRINWTGLPVTVILAVPNCGSWTTNAGESVSQGVELESSLYLTDMTRLDLGISYNKAQLKGDSSLGSDGDDLPGAADINFTAALEHGFALFGHDAFARIDYSYVGEYDTYINQQESVPTSGGYHQVNLKSGISMEGVNIDVFVRNLTDADDLTWVEAWYGNSILSGGVQLRPRTVGMNISYHF